MYLNVLIKMYLVQNNLIPIGLTAAASTAAAAAIDAANQIKFFGSGTTILIISNEEMDVIMKIVKYLEEPGLSIKFVGEIIKKE